MGFQGVDSIGVLTFDLFGGFPKLGETFFGGFLSQEFSYFGVYFGSPYEGNLPNRPSESRA